MIQNHHLIHIGSDKAERKHGRADENTHANKTQEAQKIPEGLRDVQKIVPAQMSPLSTPQGRGQFWSVGRLPTAWAEQI